MASLLAHGLHEDNSLDVIDENIHVAGAFQVAGYPCAIGSMWFTKTSEEHISRDYFENLCEKLWPSA